MGVIGLLHTYLAWPEFLGELALWSKSFNFDIDGGPNINSTTTTSMVDSNTSSKRFERTQNKRNMAMKYNTGAKEKSCPVQERA